jgi:transcriptional regulator with XRE-family HTH domain
VSSRRRGSNAMEGRPFSPLGEVMMELAERRHIRRPRSIEKFIKERTGYSPSNVSITHWLHGDARPTAENLQRFADAFGATHEDRVRLAWADAYRTPYPYSLKRVE